MQPEFDGSSKNRTIGLTVMRRNGNGGNKKYSEAKRLTDKSVSKTSILFIEYYAINCPYTATLITMNITTKINNLTTDHSMHIAELSTYQCPLHCIFTICGPCPLVWSFPGTQMRVRGLVSFFSDFH